METVKQKTFKEKFSDLTQEMTNLINSATDDDLRQSGVAVFRPQSVPEIPLIAKTEEEFLEGLLIRTTGDKSTFIFQKSDEITREEAREAVGKKRKFILPSVVKPTGVEITFNPYIIFFTPDMKLAMLPYDGQCFSDMFTRVGEVDARRK